ARVRQIENQEIGLPVRRQGFPKRPPAALPVDHMLDARLVAEAATQTRLAGFPKGLLGEGRSDRTEEITQGHGLPLGLAKQTRSKRLSERGQDPLKRSQNEGLATRLKGLVPLSDSL